MKRIVPGEYLRLVRPPLGELRTWSGDNHYAPPASLAILCTYSGCGFFVTFNREDDGAIEMLLNHYLKKHPHTLEEEDA